MKLSISSIKYENMQCAKSDIKVEIDLKVKVATPQRLLDNAPLGSERVKTKMLWDHNSVKSVAK